MKRHPVHDAERSAALRVLDAFYLEGRGMPDAEYARHRAVLQKRGAVFFTWRVKRQGTRTPDFSLRPFG